MVIYRPHRGSYKESMDEKMEFKTINEMKLHVAKEINLPIEGVSLSNKPINDNRNNWIDTRYVKVSIDGVEFVVGMCATDYPKHLLQGIGVII